MSSVEAPDPVGEVARRHRRAQVALALVYLGIPLLFIAVTLWISSTRTPFAWQALVFPVAVLVLGWFLRRRRRYQPGRWVAAGALFGGITLLYTAFYSFVLDVPVVLSVALLVGSLVGAFLGALLGMSAQRAILAPLLPELAATQYEPVFPLRGLLLTTLTVGTTSVTVRGRTVRTRGAGRRTYPLTAITGVYPTSLTGSERLKFPIALPAPPVLTAGPALILQAQGDDWVLPLNQGPAIVDFLQRRVNTAKL
ncbi:MAG TPA: hypothetical protein VGD34_03265 [Kribbella sp.]